MGNYLNPGNSGFEAILKTPYVDKTGLIGLINHTIGTKQMLTCISRPRRFGKSFAAQMLCAYYDKTCDSSALFHHFAIAKDPQYTKYLNQFDVIFLDMTGVIGETDPSDLVPYIKRNILRELTAAYPDLEVSESFISTLIGAVSSAGNRFVMIIDEWDAPIRETKNNTQAQRAYLEFLRTLFKNSSAASQIFAAAYMTGILPIKKDGSQSAISDFMEFSILDPGRYAVYTGFTEDEVRTLCDVYQMDFDAAKDWYDGYSFDHLNSVYNPYSIMSAMLSGKYKSYWKKTSAAESLLTYIDMDEEGLQDDIAKMISGEEIEVDTESFENDFETMHHSFITMNRPYGLS